MNPITYLSPRNRCAYRIIPHEVLEAWSIVVRIQELDETYGNTRWVDGELAGVTDRPFFDLDLAHRQVLSLL